jgi:hypothetical protein
MRLYLSYVGTPVPSYILLGVCLNIYMDEIEVEKFKLKTEIKLPSPSGNGNPRKRHRPGEKFLCGPIPWDWLTAAARLRGRATQVAIAIWFLRFVKGSMTIRLSGKVLRELGVERKAGYRATKALERAGLISCVHALGKSPIVTILIAPTLSNGNGKESGMKGEQL